jgi:hypothetical protein
LACGAAPSHVLHKQPARWAGPSVPVLGERPVRTTSEPGKKWAGQMGGAGANFVSIRVASEGLTNEARTTGKARSIQIKRLAKLSTRPACPRYLVVGWYSRPALGSFAPSSQPFPAPASLLLRMLPLGSSEFSSACMRGAGRRDGRGPRPVIVGCLDGFRF